MVHTINPDNCDELIVVFWPHYETSESASDFPTNTQRINKDKMPQSSWQILEH